MSTTIRVSEQTRDRFAKLADVTGCPMTQLLDEAADATELRALFDRSRPAMSSVALNQLLGVRSEAERAVENGSVRDSSS